MEGYAVDQSLAANNYFPKINLKQCNLETENIPFDTLYLMQYFQNHW